jgi:uncharacterized protein (DUF488 family)
MFYRRKVILALLQLFDGRLEMNRLQILLFLFTTRQTKAEYDFIPYFNGSYSFSAEADIATMVSKEMLNEIKDHITKHDKTDYLKQLKPADQQLLQDVKASFGKMSAKLLMKYAYLHHPFYAVRSDTVTDILTKEEMEKVLQSKPKSKKTILFTIGYEGISLEEYLQRLIKNDVKVLVDVRNNPMSMKFGFSKKPLKKYCGSVGIQYVHIPEVGIQSDQRHELNTQADYDKLFEVYRKINLRKTVAAQTNILNILKEHKRIALTCFEADICQCHRKPLAEAIEKLPGFQYEVIHI